MSKIVEVRAREILDSRLNPTVQGIVRTSDGLFKANVPSGASTGTHEAHELRDNDKSRYGGRGVLRAVDNIVHKIAPAVTGMDPVDQAGVDRTMRELDGTSNLSTLGANSVLAVSMAVARAGAGSKGVPLYRHIADIAGVAHLTIPTPFLNVINGGYHAGNELAMQEFKIAPTGTESFREGIRIAAETFQALQQVIKVKYGQNAINVGNEGGFAPNISTGRQALDLITAAVQKAGHSGIIQFGMDPAASEFYEDGRYYLNKKKKVGSAKSIDPRQLDSVYEGYIARYPVILLEDPHHEEGFKEFARITARIGEKIEVVGDDIFVTNLERLQKGIDVNAANSVLIKLNQNGTVTGTLDVVALARRAGWRAYGSHRSGETGDDFLADFSVGADLRHVKFGASRSERVEKANRLLEIEEELGGEASYAGGNLGMLRRS